MKNLGNVFILGDSYSTFDGFIPSWCAPYYGPDIKNESGVYNVKNTWWHQLIADTNSNLVLNSSYSGTTICHTGYDGNDCSEDKSFIARMRLLINEGFFQNNKIDTFFIFGGTNDSWANSPIGEINYGEKTEKELFSVLPAICYLTELVKETCPQAQIIAVVNNNLKSEIEVGFKEITAHYGIKICQLEAVDKVAAHPTALGMTQICRQILQTL